MFVEWPKSAAGERISSTRLPLRGVDREVARLAAAQHNVVGLDQLVELGLSPSAVVQREACGRLHRIHEGVYAVAAVLSGEGRLIAAALACGQQAVVSHRSAAGLLGLLRDSRAVIDVIAPKRRGRSVEGIRAHACSLATEDRVEVSQIPCTSVARTLVDLAGAVSERPLRSAVRHAEVLRLLDVREVERTARRISRPRGIVRLRRLLAEFDPDQLQTESELEARFLDLCIREGLPRPAVNVPIAVDGIEIRPDFAWPAERLIVELDGARFHSTASGVERDKRRDQRLLLAGWSTVRVTWTQLRSEPILLASSVRQLLSDRAN